MSDATNICCVKCNSILDKALLPGARGRPLSEVRRALAGPRRDHAARRKLPETELVRLRGLLTGQAGPPPIPTESIAPCPACPGKLSEVMLGAVHVDYCGRCQGIFLDQGELEAAVDAVRARDRDTRPHEIVAAISTVSDLSRKGRARRSSRRPAPDRRRRRRRRPGPGATPKAGCVEADQGRRRRRPVRSRPAPARRGGGSGRRSDARRAAARAIEPADVGHAQPIAAQARARADPHLAGRRVDAQHEPALAGSGRQPAPLADGEGVRAGVLADAAPVWSSTIAPAGPAPPRAATKAWWSPSGMKQICCESGLSALGRPCRRASARTSSLVCSPSGNQTRCQHLGPDAEQEVGLILGRVARARQRSPPSPSATSLA